MKTLIAIALLLCATTALANPDQQGERPPPPRRGPPPEAFEACKAKPAGTPAEMKNPRGETVKGSCRLVLVPDRDGRDER